MINNAIIISDLHCGCQFGLCPPKIRFDGGGVYVHSKFQKKTWQWWQEFWDNWVPTVTRKEPYIVIINGDTLDGTHHNSNHQITHNLTDQKKIAEQILAPIAELCNGNLYLIRGTSAHVGPSGQEEEELGKRINAIPDDNGNYSRFEMWVKLGGKCLIHALHHIGTTGSMAYETTALMKEFAESTTEAARWGLDPPNVVVRSHRHRHAEIRVPTADKYGYCFTTPAWQLKTPFVYKIPGGRLTQPQVGGSLVRQGDEEFYTRHYTRVLPRTPIVKV